MLDTGSKDCTIRNRPLVVAHRLFDFVRVDDFAAAEMRPLARATGDYAFWLDADDLIEPHERKKLEALLARLRRGRGNARLPVRCKCDPGPDGSGGDTVVDHIRLFPLIDGVRWTYRVHEQILPALKRAGVPVQWTDIAGTRHTGYADRRLCMKKLGAATGGSLRRVGRAASILSRCLTWATSPSKAANGTERWAI